MNDEIIDAYAALLAVGLPRISDLDKRADEAARLLRLFASIVRNEARLEIQQAANEQLQFMESNGL